MCAKLPAVCLLLKVTQDSEWYPKAIILFFLCSICLHALIYKLCCHYWHRRQPRHPRGSFNFSPFITYCFRNECVCHCILITRWTFAQNHTGFSFIRLELGFSPFLSRPFPDTKCDYRGNLLTDRKVDEVLMKSILNYIYTVQQVLVTVFERGTSC